MDTRMVTLEGCACNISNYILEVLKYLWDVMATNPPPNVVPVP